MENGGQAMTENSTSTGLEEMIVDLVGQGSLWTRVRMRAAGAAGRKLSEKPRP